MTENHHMRWPAAVISVAALAFLSVLARAQPPSPIGQSHQPSALSHVAEAYVGSEACRRCHVPQYDSWKKSLHVQMTKPIAGARVVGDFRPGTRLEQYGRAYAMEARDGRYFISVTRGRRPAETFEVHYTLGVNRFQGYLSKLPDGRIYVLPVFWH